MNNKLLVKLSKHTSRKNEDFVTDSFIHLLEHLIKNSPIMAEKIIKTITGFNTKFNLETTDICTRNFEKSKDGICYPDIEIFDDTHYAIIEVKVGANIDQEQLSKYKQIIKNLAGKKESNLAMIIGSKSNIDELGNDVHLIRWYQIAVILAEKTSRKSQLTKYLIDQFLELLRFNSVYSYPEIGIISKEFGKHLRATLDLKILRDDSILYQRNPKKNLAKVPRETKGQLPNLFKLLDSLSIEIKNVFKPKQIKFATFESRMIGLTIKNLDGFWIEYSNPDILAMQFYNNPNGIRESYKRSSSCDKDDLIVISQGKKRYNRYLNINDAGYFKMNTKDQSAFLNSELQRFKTFCHDQFGPQNSPDELFL